MSLKVKDYNGDPQHLETEGDLSAAPGGRVVQRAKLDASGTVASSAPSSAIQVAGRDSSDNLQTFELDGSGRLRTVVEGTTAVSLASSVDIGTMPAVTLSSLPSTDIGTTIGSVGDSGPSKVPDRFRLAPTIINAAAVPICAAPTSGRKRRFSDILIQVSADCTVTFTEETTGTTIWAFRAKEAKGTDQLTFRGMLKLDTADKRLYAQSDSGSATVQILTLSTSEL